MMRALAFIGLSLVPTIASATFSDVPQAYEHRRAIEYLQQAGVIRGYDDGTFRPTGMVNRAELLKILVGGLGIEPDPNVYRECFPDVIDQWYAPFVCYAQSVGWVQGYPDGTFGPEKPVRFAEALKMLANVRGYPPAPSDESVRRGVDPAAWFAPYLTTTLLIDVVSYEQVWSDAAVPLSQPLRRGFVAQLLYRALLAEGKISLPFDPLGCGTSPASVKISTYVDVLLPSKTNVFRQDIFGIDASGKECVLAIDANPFGRVSAPLDAYFLQPYPAGQPIDSWTTVTPLSMGRAVFRGAKLGGAGFRPEVFVVDVVSGELRQLPSIFAGAGGSMQTMDGRYVVFVGTSGTTIEAVDVIDGTHAVIDAVPAPLTFMPTAHGGQAFSLSFDGRNIVTYAVYDSREATGEDNAFLETRTADIDFIVHPTAVPTIIDPLSFPSSTVTP